MKKTTLKKLVLFLAIGMFTLSYSAQEKIEWGAINSAPSGSYAPGIIGEDDENIYVFASSKKEYLIESYKKGQFKRQYSFNIRPENVGKNKKTTLEQVRYVDGKFIVFVSYFDKEKKEFIIFGYHIDSKTGKKEGDERELFRVDVERKSRRGTFSVNTSEDGKKLLVNHYAYYKKQKAYFDKYKLIDKDLNVELEKEEKFNKKEVTYSTSNYLVDNDGSFYYIKRLSRKEGHSLYIVSFEADRGFEKWEEELNVDDLGLDPKSEIMDLRFLLNEKNDLVVTGYYTKKRLLEGCFFAKIDQKSKELVVKKVNEFDKKFKDQFRSKRQVKKGKDAKVKNSFHMIDVLKKEDGGVVMIGELYIYRKYTDRDGNTIGETFIFGDLVSINFSPEGDLIWANRIPKKQTFTWSSMGPIVFSSNGMSLLFPKYSTLEYFSYTASLSDGKLVVLFNDNPKNNLSTADETKMKGMKKPKKATVTKFTIDLASGEKKEELFVGAKAYDILFKPQVSYQQNENSQVYTYGDKGKKYKWGELK